MNYPTGAAGKQIVWFYEKPTVRVCEACEIPVHHEDNVCPVCKGEITFFVKENV